MLFTQEMKKVGNTATDSVIVEMTTQEFEALQQLQGLGGASDGRVLAAQELPQTMDHNDLATYVAKRLIKLSPKKKEAVVRSIESMFQFTGGIESSKVDKLISTLQKQKFFTIAPDGRVTYQKG